MSHQLTMCQVITADTFHTKVRQPECYTVGPENNGGSVRVSVSGLCGSSSVCAGSMPRLVKCRGCAVWVLSEPFCRKDLPLAVPNAMHRATNFEIS